VLLIVVVATLFIIIVVIAVIIISISLVLLTRVTRVANHPFASTIGIGDQQIVGAVLLGS